MLKGTDIACLCPIESIREHFTSSVKTSLYFPKFFAIGLLVNRTVCMLDDPTQLDDRLYWRCMRIIHIRFVSISTCNTFHVLTSYISKLIKEIDFFCEC